MKQVNWNINYLLRKHFVNSMSMSRLDPVFTPFLEADSRSWQLQFFFLFLVFYGGGEGESKIIDEYPLYDEPVGFNKYRGMKFFMCLVI